MKYLNTMIGFREFPDEISLLINITGCCWHCLGCHSPELWKDIGTELTQHQLEKLIESNSGITCIGFMGGQPETVNTFAAYIKNNYSNLKVGWYYGGEKIPEIINLYNFDYIKIGPYIKELGGLDSPITNQKFYTKGKHLHKIDANDNMLYDTTYKFQINDN